MSDVPQMDLLAFGHKAESKKPQDEEPKVLTISQLNRAVKNLLEGTFALIWIRGEISNFKAHSSGHFYFSLKDENSQVSAVMFKGYNRGLRFRPADGVEVLIRGRVTVFEPRGNYQIFCESMEPMGAGALQLAFEQLKKKLKGEGLFEAGRKKPLPVLPKHVALVTSPTGAAVRDMLNVLGRRFRGLEVTVVPCRVQGEGAALTIVEALNQVERLHLSRPVDVIICGRGGGSMEDLWAFNEEVLARKIAQLNIPIVSAVGHEVDFTIADFVADLRAPTPSAAAELVVKNAGDIKQQIINLQRRLLGQMQGQLKNLRQRVDFQSRRLVDPKRYLQDMAIRCDDLVQRLETAVFRYLSDRERQVELLRQRLGRPQERLRNLRQTVDRQDDRLRSVLKMLLQEKKQKWKQASALLDSLSPLRVVERGYSIVLKNNKVVKDVAQIELGDDVQIRFAHGEALATIKEKKLEEVKDGI